MDYSLDLTLLNFIYFPAVVINERGDILKASKKMKHEYKISAGDNFYRLCQNALAIEQFVHNLASLPIGTDARCLTELNFLYQKTNTYISVINHHPLLFLIELNDVIEHEVKALDLANHSNNLLSLVDKNYHYLAVNQKYCDTWGKPLHEIQGHHVKEILGEEAFQSVVKKELDKSFAGKVCSYSDWFYSEKKDQLMFLKVVYQPVIDKTDNQVTSVAVTVTDITEIQSRYETANENAYIDALTQLNNRHALQKHFEQLPSKSQHSYCLIFIDLDNFKPINDTFGHELGDKVLQMFSARLTRLMRDDDFCCRWGGDEFIIILPIKGDLFSELSLRENLASRFAALTKDPFAIDKHSIEIGFSFGVSFYSPECQSLETLVNMADQDMYHHKFTQPKLL